MASETGPREMNGGRAHLKRLNPRQSHQERHNHGQSTLDLPTHARRLSSRASSACQTCRQKKVRCDEGRPECSFCIKHGFRCDYRSSQEFLEFQLASIIEQLGTWEKTVHQLSSVIQRHDSILSANLADSDDSVFEEISPPSQPRECASMVSLHSNGNSPPCYDAGKEEDPTSSTPITIESILTKHHSSSGLKKNLTPDVLESFVLPNLFHLNPLVQTFFDKICPLYPIICDIVAMKATSAIVAKGYGESIDVCLALLLVAIGRESDDWNGNHGLADFQYATTTLRRLQFEFSLEFAQAEILSGVYLYRKSKILESWKYIHAGCTTLYVMIQKDLRYQTQRDRVEQNTILRLYWVSLNLERDLLTCYPDLPESALSSFEDVLALPLGCEESTTSHMPMSTRTIYTFFLAETGLKAILRRIPNCEKSSLVGLPSFQNSHNTLSTPSPVVEELECQLSTWLTGVPSFLGWSTESCKGTQTKLGTRLKLLYWFARFSLDGSSVGYALAHSEECFPMQAWTTMQDTLFAAYNLVKVFVLEKSDPDPVLEYRIRLVIPILESAATKGMLQRKYMPDLEALLQRTNEIII